MTFGEKLKLCRIARDLTQADLANLVGTTKQVVSLYETGGRTPKVDAAAKYAAVLDVPMKYLVNNLLDMCLWESDDLLEDYWLASPSDKLRIVSRRGIDPRIASDYEKVSALAQLARAEKTPANIIPMPTMHKVPLIGSIACGTPILAEENREGAVDVPDHVHADFALRCKGDSMINARIFDGDVVYIRQQETVEHGEIAAVLVGDEATLKRVYAYDDCLSLEAENPLYKPMVFRGEEMNRVRILGKAVAFTSLIR